MALFTKFKTRKNGSTTYRQDNSTVSVSFPATAFTGAAPDMLEISAENLSTGPAARVKGVRQEDPAIAAARKVLADAKVARKAALEAKIAAMTPEQLAKRAEALAKAKARAKAKK